VTDLQIPRAKIRTWTLCLLISYNHVYFQTVTSTARHNFASSAKNNAIL